ncbi:MAG TPA: YihY/virulence factor BrkB family protein [Longimicrobiaceae bacterium]|jgi:membrane protein|nr:YihY/virulence factor BrkB family protein [Longimicrobiaceae bacterium]
MASWWKEGFGLLKDSVTDFLDDDCPQQAAAISYYTVFSLPPLLILILAVVGAVMDPQDVQGALERQISSLIGSGGAEEVRTIIAHADRPGSGRSIASVFGVLALVFGATGAFGQLQAALNRAWEVKPDPKQGGLKNFVVKRLFSFGLILGIAFLLLVSLALSAALTALGNALGGMVPGGLSATLLEALNMAISFVVISSLFAAMFKILPDAKIALRDVWVGAIATTVLFLAGKLVLGLYLGNSDPGSAFGSAGSLALILVWIYYSSMILLFGAEFTQSWATRRGRGIEPEQGAVRVKEEEKEIRGPEAQASG